MSIDYDLSVRQIALARKNATTALIDDIRYTYNTTQNNRLRSVNDVISGNEGLESGIHTYTYDEIGNLTSDKEIQEINWTVYGKIAFVKKRDLTEIEYKYDGTGQRIYKKVVSSSVSKETHYVRDGSGNVLAIYENKILDELVIYGSSRLGSYNAKTEQGKRTLGNKKYELSNHLGNVLSVISDNKVGIDSDADFIADYYEPLVISESDYYPFGMAMKERSFSNEEYRFGFNTQEKTPEIGEDTYTAEFWQYDSKIARRWNVDPVVKHYESSYVAFGGNPIWFIDPSGADSTAYITNAEGEEYNQEEFEAIAANAQKMANANGANFVTFKAIDRNDLIEKIKNGKLDYETDLVYIYDKGEKIGITGRTIYSLSGWDKSFTGITGGYIYGTALNSYINKDPQGNIVKESEYYHVATTLFHESFSHGFHHLINRKLHGKTNHTKYGSDMYGIDASNSAMYAYHIEDSGTDLTEKIITQKYTLSNTNIVSNISNFFAYVHYSRQKEQLNKESNSLVTTMLIQGNNDAFQVVEQKMLMYNLLIENAKSNIKPLHD